ncbi:MAG: peptidylprolyl isomerase [Akkermansiaceae bacterium]|nr:peptidylprolyl isomerase [Akkermansiaceae bacterium]MCF7732864.1 peptidylprolyl isomerase [Akkermansiaceae bacterium]
MHARFSIPCSLLALFGAGLPDVAHADFTFYQGRTQYILVTTASTWDQAEADAVARGGHLAQINDAAENALILSKVGTLVTTTAPDGGEAKYLWLGGRETTTEGNYAWADGSTFWAGGSSGTAQGGLYQNWGRSTTSPYGGPEPDNYQGTQNRSAMAVEKWPVGVAAGQEIGQAGQWNDVNHTNGLQYLIERPITKPAEGLFAVFQMSHDGRPAGSFTCQLHYDKAPIAVANFITLVEGSRSWIDVPRGRVANQPYYNGLKCHRIIANFMIQGGDPKGTGTGGPGYVFPDEFDPSLRHDHPGVLSMANSGANTNGSQFFVTVSERPSLNDVHTIFGEVVEGYESCVLPLSKVATSGSDVPVQDVVISGVAIERLGAAAQAFDPLAQSLPRVTAPQAVMTVANPAAGLGTITVNQPARSLLSLFQTTNLTTWNSPVTIYLDRNASPTQSLNVDPYVKDVPTQFFRVPITEYPSDAMAPSAMAGRTLTVQTGYGPLTVVFSPTGGGTVLLDGLTNGITEYEHTPEGYSSTLLVFTDGLRPLLLHTAFDAENPTLFSGRASANYYNNGWQSFSGTSFTLTK